jgi:hypothetical protein
MTLDSSLTKIAFKNPPVKKPWLSLEKKLTSSQYNLNAQKKSSKKLLTARLRWG